MDNDPNLSDGLQESMSGAGLEGSPKNQQGILEVLRNQEILIQIMLQKLCFLETVTNDRLAKQETMNEKLVQNMKSLENGQNLITEKMEKMEKNSTEKWNKMEEQEKIDLIAMEKLNGRFKEADFTEYEKIMKKLEDMEKTMETMKENQETSSEVIASVINAMETMENKSAEGQTKFTKEMIEQINERIQTIQKNTDKEKDVAVNYLSTASSLQRRFVIRHVSPNVSKLGVGFTCRSEDEYHYGVPWYIGIKRGHGFLGAHLYCRRTEKSEKWSIETDYEIKFIHPNGKTFSKNEQFTFVAHQGYGCGDFLDWDEMERDYLMNDQLIMEIHVKINKITGVYGEPLKNFNASESSTMTLTIEEKKFHVEKEILSSNSSFFNSLFAEFPAQDEHKLSDVDSETFQKYLEVLHGEPAINETTVEGILHIAFNYSTPSVIQKCEEFLLKLNCKLTGKIEMAIKYKLKNLTRQCLQMIDEKGLLGQSVISQLNQGEIYNLLKNNL